jgi:hypothetical protein
MRNRKTGPWVTTGSVLVLLALVASFELLFLTSLGPGTHLTPTHSSLGALFWSWRSPGR